MVLVLNANTTTYVDNPVGLSLMPYPPGEHWLSDTSLYRLTSLLVSAPTSAHKHPVLISPSPINRHMLFDSFNMRVVSCLQVACSMKM